MAYSFAQTFTINTQKDFLNVIDTNEVITSGIPGVFITGIGLFFFLNYNDKGLGVRATIFKTSGGVPAMSQPVPMATVHLNPNDILTSKDSSAETIFNFPYPIYLQNGVQYAVCLDYDGNDPDFYIYTAKKDISTVDFISGNKLDNLTYNGNLLTSADGSSWTLLQNEQLKINLYRAAYSLTPGTVSFVPADTDRFNLTNITLSNSYIIPDASAVAFLAPNTTYNSSNTSHQAKLDYFGYPSQRVHLKNSTRNFTSTNIATYPVMQFHKFASEDPTKYSSSFSASTLVGYANVVNSYAVSYNSIRPQFSDLTPPGTTISFGLKGMNSSYVLDSNFINVFNNKNNVFNDYTRFIYNKSNPSVSTDPLVIQATLSTNNSWTAPVIDQVRGMVTVNKSLVNPTTLFFYDEFFNGGSAFSKYISTPITLAMGQDASDIKVYMTAHRPKNTDLRVYIKFLNGNDPEGLNDKTWTPLKNLYSNYFTDSDENSSSGFFEYQYYLAANNTVDLTSFGTSYVANVNITSGSATVTGLNTKFLTSLDTGFVIYVTSNGSVNYAGERKRVTAIASNTSLTVDSTFSTTVTGAPYYLTFPLTTAFYSNSGLFSQPGTISVSTTSTTVTGTATNFINGVLKVGNYINIPTTAVDSDVKRIVSIANSTSLTIDSPVTVSNSTATFSIVTYPGVNYRNNDGSVYAKYKTFQIKVLFHADDPSVSPAIKDIRAIAVT